MHEDFFVVRFDNAANILHTAVADFHSARIENLVQRCVFWEVYGNQLQELLCHVGLHVLAKWGGVGLNHNYYVANDPQT